MSQSYGFLEEDELAYRVDHRPDAQRSRSAKRYSPRHQKQAAPTNCRGGMRLRGSRKKSAM